MFRYNNYASNENKPMGDTLAVAKSLQNKLKGRKATQ